MGRVGQAEATGATGRDLPRSRIAGRGHARQVGAQREARRPGRAAPDA
jgi:hypothetical protein